MPILRTGQMVASAMVYGLLVGANGFNTTAQCSKPTPAPQAQGIETKRVWIEVGPWPTAVSSPDQEKVEVCSHSCMIFVEPETSAQKTLKPSIGLTISATTAIADSPDVRLTVTLSNLSHHDIRIKETATENPGFGYRLYAFGACQCPGQLNRGAMDAGSPERTHGPDFARLADLKLKPGTNIKDTMALGKLMDLTKAGSYVLVARRYDSSRSKTGRETLQQLLISSNSLLVTVHELN